MQTTDFRAVSVFLIKCYSTLCRSVLRHYRSLHNGCGFKPCVSITETNPRVGEFNLKPPPSCGGIYIESAFPAKTERFHFLPIPLVQCHRLFYDSQREMTHNRGFYALFTCFQMLFTRHATAGRRTHVVSTTKPRGQKTAVHESAFPRKKKVGHSVGEAVLWK